MKNLEQIRSSNAIKHRHSTFPGNEGGQVVKKIPTLIRENGLLATAAFAREKRKSKRKSGHEMVFDCVIEHLSDADIAILKEPLNLDDFITYLSTEVSSSELRRITSETNAFLSYLRRFASAIES